MYNILEKVGSKPKIQQLDNSTSKGSIVEITKKNLDFEVTPPGNHWNLPVKWVIGTFKTHLILFLLGCDPTFPATCWDILIVQCILSLNVVRPSQINLKKSAYNEIWGKFDCNDIPLGPPGCNVVVHDCDHTSWASGGKW